MLYNYRSGAARTAWHSVLLRSGTLLLPKWVWHVFIARAMIKVSIESLEIASKDRPPGYLKEVTRKGRVEDGVLYLDDEVYGALRKRFSPHAPSIARQAQTAGAALTNFVGAALKGKVLVSKKEIARRLSICKDCEFFQKSPMRCLKCGCFLNLKTRLKSEHCPIAKW
jgi:hypothetical protein